MRRARLASVLAALALFGAHPAAAGPETMLSPQTKVQVKVVEWLASTGEYKPWEALDGEYAVAADGTLSLPLIGPVDVRGQTAAAAEKRMADVLQAATGLRSPLYVNISVLEYPSVYVVGDVTTAGAFPYRPDMTVLQALSVAGGRLRDRDERDGIGIDQIGYVGDIELAEKRLVRARARQARLEAEEAGVETADGIGFPSDIGAGALAEQVVAEEKSVFLARADAVKRQLQALEDLKTMLASEADLLSQKIAAQDQQIASARTELDTVIPLVSKGVATTSRRYDAERRLVDLQSERLDLVTAVMRAKQGYANASRDALNLVGERRIETNRELQETKAAIDENELAVVTKTRLLAETGAIAMRVKERRRQSDLPLVFEIVRNGGTGGTSMPASELTALQPGDVVRVTIDRSRTPESGGGAPAAPAADGPVHTSDAGTPNVAAR